MLKFKMWLVRLSMAAAPAIAALALGAPGVTQAAVTIVVDDVTPADHCGKYDGDTAQTDPVTAISSAANGSTVVICPGTYTLNGVVALAGLTKLTVKRALTGPGDTPTLVTDPNEHDGVSITGSSGITFDGLVIDGRQNVFPAYDGFRLEDSGITIRNSAILGPDHAGSSGIVVENLPFQEVAPKVTITDTAIDGYQDYGLFLYGASTLVMTDCHLDGTDGGRFASNGGIGVKFFGHTHDPLSPTGSVSRSRVLNSGTGVDIEDATNVTVSDNIFVNVGRAVDILQAGDYRRMENIKITGNTIYGSSEAITALNTDMVGWKLTNLTITDNVMSNTAYLSGGIIGYGIRVFAANPTNGTETGKVTGNTMMGYPVTSPSFPLIFDANNPDVRISSNTFLP